MSIQGSINGALGTVAQVRVQNTLKDIGKGVKDIKETNEDIATQTQGYERPKSASRQKLEKRLAKDAIDKYDMRHREIFSSTMAINKRQGLLTKGLGKVSEAEAKAYSTVYGLGRDLYGNAKRINELREEGKLNGRTKQ